MRDSQRSAVYAWGRLLLHAWPHLATRPTLDEARTIINNVFLLEGRCGEEPAVAEGRTRPYYHPDRNVIYLPTPKRTLLTVLHEIAHALCGYEEGHGPVFTSRLVELLVVHASIPREAALSMGRGQRPRRVRFDEAASLRIQVRI